MKHTHTQISRFGFLSESKLFHLFFIAMFMFSISSCNDNVDDNIDVGENTTAVRNSPCGPTGSDCQTIIAQNYLYTNGPCEITVNMTITRCLENGQFTYFFEDDGVPVSSNGNCVDMLEEIELAYDEFIAFNMDIATSQESTDCSEGETVSSKQIKNECTRLCEGPGKEGQTNFRWVPCADEQGCCIKTIRWCYEDGDLVFSEPEITDNTIGCKATTPNCNPTNDPFQVIEPCGGRCDR